MLSAAGKFFCLSPYVQTAVVMKTALFIVQLLYDLNLNKNKYGINAGYEADQKSQYKFSLVVLIFL